MNNPFLQEIIELKSTIKRYEEVLKRIANAKPDRLDHRIDVGRLEKAIKLAKSKV